MKTIMNFYRLHTYGIWQVFLFTTAVLCLIYACKTLDASVFENRSFWCQSTGFFFAIAFPLFASLASTTEPGIFKHREQRAFIFALIWGYTTLQLLFLIGNLPFVIPLILALSALIWFHKKNSKAPRRIQGGIWMVVILTVISSFFMAGYQTHRKNQDKALAEQALKNPPIKIIDVKENYIYTKEFGLERMRGIIPLTSGQEIYRAKAGDDYIIVVVK